MLFETTGQPSWKCSTAGTAGLAGCECNFLGACDVHGKQKPGLNISNHAPQGLEVYARVKNVLFGRNLAFLCEGNTVAILYDCTNRIPLYAATVVSGSQFLVAPGTRPKGKDAKFRQSGTGLQKRFQQKKSDYLKPYRRELYTSRRKPALVKSNRQELGTKLGKQLRIKLQLHEKRVDIFTTVHRGHMIASQYGRGDYKKKYRLLFTLTLFPNLEILT